MRDALSPQGGPQMGPCFYCGGPLGCCERPYDRKCSFDPRPLEEVQRGLDAALRAFFGLEEAG
jgi:hypothetical protein